MMFVCHSLALNPQPRHLHRFSAPAHLGWDFLTWDAQLILGLSLPPSDIRCPSPAPNPDMALAWLDCRGQVVLYLGRWDQVILAECGPLFCSGNPCALT